MLPCDTKTVRGTVFHVQPFVEREKNNIRTESQERGTEDEPTRITWFLHMDVRLCIVWGKVTTGGCRTT